MTTRPSRMRSWRQALGQVLLAGLALMPLLAPAQDGVEARIRKNLAQRLPSLPPVDQVTRMPMNGLFEVRIGNEVMYSDADGRFLIQGTVLDLVTRRNLTEERTEQLSRVGFDQLPLKTAFTQVRGKGERKLVVFADPNCGYCKRFERDLRALDNVTIHHVLIPILGDDSMVKSRHIWCARDRAATWNAWMIEGKTPPAAQCDDGPLKTNLAFARAHNITGTPTLFLADGSRIVGAVPMAQVEKALDKTRP